MNIAVMIVKWMILTQPLMSAFHDDETKNDEYLLVGDLLIRWCIVYSLYSLMNGSIKYVFLSYFCLLRKLEFCEY